MSIREKNTAIKQKLTAFLMLGLFVVQCLVPQGYMPASLTGEGSLIKLCPAGVSDAVMAVLHKGHGKHLAHRTSVVDHSQHAAHKHHHHASVHATPVAGDHATFDGVQSSVVEEHMTTWSNICDFGIAASFDDDGLPAATMTDHFAARQLEQQLLIAEHVLVTQRRKQLSRAPPSFIS